MTFVEAVRILSEQPVHRRRRAVYQRSPNYVRHLEVSGGQVFVEGNTPCISDILADWKLEERSDGSKRSS